MHMSKLIDLDHISVDPEVSSKKRAIELLSHLLSQGSEHSGNEIFDVLLGRERLGSTALGEGIAIPHGRIKGLKQPLGAFIKLHEGIDYDSPDKRPVDLLFTLIVPENCTEDHLRILAQLARLFRDKETVDHLRQCNDRECIFNILTQWDRRHAA